MRPYKRRVFGLIVLLATTVSVFGQVRIEVPVNSILYGTEFTISQNVLNTGNNDKWKPSGVNPTMWSTGSYFTHTSLPGVTLPSSVLLWQLESIGGQPAPFRKQDGLPGFQWFTTSPQNWYLPNSTAGYFTPGNVVFKFKITPEAFLANTFVPGEYKLNVTHNYGSNGSGVRFTPDNIEIIIVIPSTTSIQWISNNTSLYHEVSSLSGYRSSSDKLISIGLTEISNSVPFNLWGRTTASTIQFTSSKGVESTRFPSLIKLGSTDPKIVTSPLAEIWKSYSPNRPFIVEAGNRNTFDLHLSISAADFKTYFFEAGTYRFQLNMDAKGINSSVSTLQNMDVTLKVLPLSEITVPTSGNEVNFEFNTVAQYHNGQTKIIPNQLKISNNETYELYVRSDVAFFSKSGVQSDIPTSVLQVGVEGGSQNVSLTPSAQKVINSGTPVLDKDLNIKYTISPSAAQSLVEKEKTSYSVNVIYSFTAI